MRLIPRGIVNAHPFGMPFRECAGVAFDGTRGEFLVCDPKANRISVFSTEGFGRFTIGEGAGVREPRAIALGKGGDLFVVDAIPGRVWRLNYRGEPTSSLDFSDATGSPAAVIAIAATPDGGVAVLSSSPAWVRVLGPDLHERLRITAPADKSLLQSPTDLAVGADGKIYVTNHADPAVQIFDPNGALVGSWGRVGEGSGATDFSLPTGIAVDPAGRILLIDSLRQDIRAYQSDGRLLGIWGGFGTGLGAVAFPADLCLDPEGQVAIVSEKGGRRVTVFRIEFEPAKTAPPADGATPTSSTPTHQ
ncbi:MAG: NHL repeat-containing protein [Planctomycetes bacterium]|nr:NHL repeat-containing protein [Planctomycetota bacterium]MBI3845507.1 NHL repeat-containing protein [Planctomycetota bacterium]